MTIVLLCCVIGLLLISNLCLVVVLFKLQKKTTYMSDKEKEFIDFAIDMYVDYAEELNINTHEQHELIVKHLKKIQNKHIKKRKEDV